MPRKDPTPSAFQSAMAGLAANLLRFTPWRVALGAGASLGRIGGFVLRGKRTRIHENLRIAGAADPARGSREAPAHLGRNFAEMLWITTRSPEEVLTHMQIRGLDELRHAASAGRGVLLVGAHLSNWELVAYAASRAGIPVAVIAREMRAPSVERRIIAFRDRCGITTLMRGRPGASIAAVRCLRRGGILGCMMDRSSGGDRMPIPFLGQATNMPTGPVELASRTGAAIVVGTARRGADGVSVISFTEVHGGEGKPVPELGLVIGAALEEHVRACPEQWLWIPRRQPSWPAAGPQRGDASQLN